MAETLVNRGLSVSQSLSVLLPVHNAQTQLAAKVAEVLEVAGELTNQLEVLIVDDGSTDETMDVARDLSRRFPQVRSIRYAIRRGLGSVIESGIAQTTGEVVLVHDGVGAVDAAEIRRLWSQRPWSADSDNRESSLAAADQRGADRLARLVAQDGARRSLPWRAESPKEASHAHVSSFHYVDRTKMSLRSKRKTLYRKDAPFSSLSAAQRVASGASSVRRPNFLERLTQFVLSQ